MASEDRLNNLLSNVPGVVYQIRITPNHVYTNEFLSEKTAEILGLDPDSPTFLEEFYQHIPKADQVKTC